MDRRFFRYVKYILPFLITALIFYVFLKRTSLESIREYKNLLRIDYLFIFISLSIAGTVLRTLRYRILLEKKIKVFDLFLITLVRNFSVDLLPARTASLLFYTYFTNREGVNIEEGGASFVVSMFYDLLSLSVLLSFALLYLSSYDNRGGLFWAVFFIFLLSLFFIIFSGKIINIISSIKFIDRFKKIKGILIELGIYFKKHNSFWERVELFLLSIFIRAFKYLSLFVLFVSLTGADFVLKKIAIFSFGISATELSSVLPVQGLAGFGTWELAFKYVFTLIGIKLKNPFLVGLIIHTITQVWEYSIGLIALIFLFLKRKVRKDI